MTFRLGGWPNITGYEHGSEAGDLPTDGPPWQIADAEAPVGGHPEVVTLRPGGGSTALVTLPGAANRVDVARDLLDRFGGAPASMPARAPRLAAPAL